MEVSNIVSKFIKIKKCMVLDTTNLSYMYKQRVQKILKPRSNENHAAKNIKHSNNLLQNLYIK